MADGTLARHTLAYVAPDAWPGVISGEDDAVLLGWADKGWPAIVRRPDCSDTGGTVALGLPLPPSMGKRRLGLRCHGRAICRTAPPPLLRDAAGAAPDAWQATIAALVDLAPHVRCFGSLAWASATGLPYLSETSDLDLIFDVRDGDGADDIARGLAGIADRAPMAIDAELTSPSGHAVQWREWHGGAGTVMVKSLESAALVPRTALFP